jgi:hypothetical protein
MDARRISDNKLDFVKHVHVNTQEVEILRMLNEPEARRDPRNHTVPVIDIFPDPFDPTRSFVIMPFLRQIDSPPFELVLDVCEFLDQIIEVGPLPFTPSPCLHTFPGPGFHA